MAPLTSRRDFIFRTGKAGLGVWLGSAFLASCASGSKVVSNNVKFRTGFQQTPLPYSYNALNEAIDGTTMEIHYSKHAAGYASNLQTAARNENVDMNQPVEEVLSRISRYSTSMRNNGGGHYNHELFWKTMSPNGVANPPSGGAITNALVQSFGSVEAFKTQFEEAAKSRFGSGWAWLIVDGDKKLRIGSTPNQDNPLMDVAEFKGFPVMGLDVWEHAYYLRYQNKRADYISNWWKVVNWDYLTERYQSVV